MKQKNKKGISRDCEDLLEDESGKETGEWIIPTAAEALVKGVIKTEWIIQRDQNVLQGSGKRKGHRR